MNQSLIRVRHFALLAIACIATLIPGCEKSDEDVNEKQVATITDYDGNIYQILQIGDQWWMADNLKTTHYADGTGIELVESAAVWEMMDADNRAYCYYNNDENNEDFTYGALYTWAAAMNGAAGSDLNPSGVQGVCPDGWHLPSDQEWKELELHLGMSQADVDEAGPRGLDVGVGSKLAINLAYWADGYLKSHPAFGTSGFSALPGGGRRYNGSFGHAGDNANFWSATEYDGNLAWGRHLYSSYSTVFRYTDVKSDGFSVRCVRDR